MWYTSKGYKDRSVKIHHYTRSVVHKLGPEDPGGSNKGNLGIHGASLEWQKCDKIFFYQMVVAGRERTKSSSKGEELGIQIHQTSTITEKRERKRGEGDIELLLPSVACGQKKKERV